MKTKLSNEHLEQIRAEQDNETVIELLAHIDALNEELENKYELVSLSDIAQMDGTSRQNAYSLSTSKQFPEPVTKVGKQRLWSKKDIERWLKERFN